MHEKARRRRQRVCCRGALSGVRASPNCSMGDPSTKVPHLTLAQATPSVTHWAGVGKAPSRIPTVAKPDLSEVPEHSSPTGRSP